MAFYNGAKALISGTTEDLTNEGGALFFYFACRPSRFGSLLYVELLMRVFGERGILLAGPVINVFLLAGAYAAILRMTGRLFQDNRVTLLTLFLLCVFLQPLVACTSIDGATLSFALSVWAVGFAIRFLQEDKKRYLVWIALLCAFSALLDGGAAVVAAPFRPRFCCTP